MENILNVVKEKWFSILIILVLLIFVWSPQISNSTNTSIYDDILMFIGYQWYIFLIYVVLVFLCMRLSITLGIKLFFGSPVKKMVIAILGLFILSIVLQLFISNRDLLHKFYEIIKNPDPFIRSIITTYCIVYDTVLELVSLVKKEKTK